MEVQHNENVEFVSTMYGSFYTWKNDHLTNQLKEHSAHTRNELGMIKDFVQSGDNILDIGAHIGTFAMPLANFNSRKGKIFSFEGNSENYDLLVENIKQNKLEEIITPIRAIVGLEEQTYEMAPAAEGNSATFTFLKSENSNDSIVQGLNIDNWMEHHHGNIRFDFVKIDIEGAEIDALHSCQNLIKETLPVLYIEINTYALERFGSSPEEIQAVLDPLGYKYFRNVGERNSNNDAYEISNLENIADGGVFFDLLAVHPSNSKFPSNDQPEHSSGIARAIAKVKNLFKPS